MKEGAAESEFSKLPTIPYFFEENGTKNSIFKFEICTFASIFTYK